jgi:large repetitive protein
MKAKSLIALRKRKRTGAQKLPVLFVFLMAVYVGEVKSALADITNTAVANGTYAGNPVQSDPVTVNVPVGPQNSQLTIVKTAAPDVNVPAGQVVTYTYTVTNSGNSTLQNISLNDVHNGSGAPPVPGNETLLTDNGTLGDTTDSAPADGVWSVLAPGDVITFTSTYTVTQQDVDTKQ